MHDLVVSGEPTSANLEPQSEHNKRKYIFKKKWIEINKTREV